MDRIKTQFAKSFEADFSKETWTFKFFQPFEVMAGEFAIVDRRIYSEMVQVMEDYKYTLEVCKTMPNFEPMEKLKILKKIEEIKKLIKQNTQ